MTPEVADSLLSFLASLAHGYDELAHKIAAAEWVFSSESPAVYTKYQTALNEQRRNANPARIALAIEDLRTRLLQD